MTPAFADKPNNMLSTDNFESSTDNEHERQEFLDKELYDNSEDYICMSLNENFKHGPIEGLQNYPDSFVKDRQNERKK